MSVPFLEDNFCNSFSFFVFNGHKFDIFGKSVGNTQDVLFVVTKCVWEAHVDPHVLAC